MKDTNPNPDQLDQLLDESLAQYSQVSPLTGLEDRILSRLEQAPAEMPQGFSLAAVRTWLTLPRMAAVATAILLGAGIWLGLAFVTGPGDDIEYVGQDTAIEVKAGTPVETATAPLPARIPQEAFRGSIPKIAEMFAASHVFKLPSGNVANPTQVETAEVRKEVFPAPAPPTEQDRLAMAFARMTERVAVAEAKIEPGIVDLEVTPLEIAPIRLEELE
ncbi:MAG TPA: hypothetical protein VM009_01715, partial [Terriglobales bacterium]|nr:hypothetical protein [Terriglobales bacterium]